MRKALLGCVFWMLTAAAHAGFSEDSIRAQLVAQGYEQIDFSQQGGEVTVLARRGKLLMTTIYDATTGELLSERVRRTAAPQGGTDAAAAPAVAKPAAPKPAAAGGSGGSGKAAAPVKPSAADHSAGRGRGIR